MMFVPGKAQASNVSKPRVYSRVSKFSTVATLLVLVRKFRLSVFVFTKQRGYDTDLPLQKQK